MSADGTGPAPLQVESLTVKLSGRIVLKDASLTVGQGEFLAVVGPNGAGKTTLLRAILGLVQPVSGRVLVQGTPVSELSTRARARRMAWVPQQEVATDDLPVEDFVSLGRYPYQGSYSPVSEEDKRAVELALTEASMQSFRNRGILELSGGERQRALYARALAQGAPILILDEPTSHLDVAYQLEVLGKLSAFRAGGRGRAVIASMHDLNMASRFADRILWLAHGRCITVGPPEMTVTSDRVFEVFGVESVIHHRGDHVFVLPPEHRPAPPTREEGSKRVHVVCGGGSGRDIMRELLLRGYLVTAGALNLLDSDEEFCQSENLTMAVEDPFTPLSEGVRSRHRDLIAAAEVVVIAPFAVGEGNLANLIDPLGYVAARPTFLMGGPPEKGRDFTGGLAGRAYGDLLRAGATEVAGLAELCEALASAPPLGGQATGPRQAARAPSR
jgi:iron complex transport system ATP-binding protein